MLCQLDDWCCIDSRVVWPAIAYYRFRYTAVHADVRQLCCLRNHQSNLCAGLILLIVFAEKPPV